LASRPWDSSANPSVIDSPDTAIEQTPDLLALAAVEGRAFTAEPVADVLGRDANEVVDLLDDYLTEDEVHLHRVLAWQGWTPIDDPRTGRRNLSRYKFVSELQWLSLDDPSTRPKAQRKLALARSGEPLQPPATG
jgi:hypothetical protein